MYCDRAAWGWLSPNLKLPLHERRVLDDHRQTLTDYLNSGTM